MTNPTETVESVLAEDREIIRQFFAHEKNRVGDYWGACMAEAAVARLAAAHEREIAELRQRLAAYLSGATNG